MGKTYAGDLDRRITVGEFSKAKSDFGSWEEDPDFHPYFQCWAKFESLVGTEGYEADQLTAKSPVKFTVRYNPAIKPTHTILFEEQYYEITAVEPQGRKQHQLIRAYAKD